MCIRDRIMTKKVNDTNRIVNDTMIINYTSTPNLFQVSKVWYNDVLKFTKVEGQPNIVKTVSYTHLDVYKRQLWSRWSTNVQRT